MNFTPFPPLSLATLARLPCHHICPPRPRAHSAHSRWSPCAVTAPEVALARVVGGRAPASRQVRLIACSRSLAWSAVARSGGRGQVALSLRSRGAASHLGQPGLSSASAHRRPGLAGARSSLPRACASRPGTSAGSGPAGRSSPARLCRPLACPPRVGRVPAAGAPVCRCCPRPPRLSPPPSRPPLFAPPALAPRCSRPPCSPPRPSCAALLFFRPAARPSPPCASRRAPARPWLCPSPALPPPPRSSPTPPRSSLPPFPPPPAPLSSPPPPSLLSPLNLSQHATRAYRVASESRSVRDQEADVFRHASAVLSTARTAGAIAKARAIADNRRLWSLVAILVRDDENQLPLTLRAQLASLGLAVQHELGKPEPDVDFVIGINEHIAAGLSGQP